MAEEVDALTIGRRIRQLRTARGLTLEELASAVDRAPSQLSMIETGKREPKLTLLRAIARALGSTIEEILADGPLDERSGMEVAVERAMKGQTFQALGIAPFRIAKTVPDEALKALLALHGEIDRLRDERAATPEEATPRERRAAPPDAQPGQPLRRPRGEGGRDPRRGAPPRRSAHPALGQRHRRAPRLHAALRARSAAVHPQRRRSRARAAVPLQPGAGQGRRAHGGAAGAVEPDPRARRAAQLRRVPAPAGRDELPHRAPC